MQWSQDPNLRNVHNLNNAKREVGRHPALKFNSTCRETFFGNSNVDFDVTGQLLILYSAFFKYLRRNGNSVKQCVSCLSAS